MLSMLPHSATVALCAFRHMLMQSIAAFFQKPRSWNYTKALFKCCRRCLPLEIARIYFQRGTSISKVKSEAWATCAQKHCCWALTTSRPLPGLGSSSPRCSRPTYRAPRR